MPVEQPVLGTNYKHLKIIRTWPQTTTIKTIRTIAIIVAHRDRQTETERQRDRERERE